MMKRMPPAIRCQIFDATQSDALEAACRIYEASIPAGERRPTDAIRDMATRPDYRLLTAALDDRVIGVAALFAPPGELFALLEYLAVDEAARGAGVGAELFRAVVGATADAGTARWLLIEVDADVCDDPADLHQQRRRQAFYRRLGCRRVAGVTYELPLRSPAKHPPPMHLFVHDVGAGPVISRADLAHALRVVYRDVYGQPADDPRIDAMLAGVPDPIEFD